MRCFRVVAVGSLHGDPSKAAFGDPGKGNAGLDRSHSTEKCYKTSC